MVRRGRLPLLIALASSGCSLLVGTEGLDDRPAPSGDGGASEGAPSSATDAGGTGPSDAAVPGPEARYVRPRGGLKMTTSGDGVHCRVDGFFDIGFIRSRQYRLASWLDLGTPQPSELSASVLLDPLRAVVDGMRITSDNGFEGAYFPEPFDETPVRVTFGAYAHHVADSGVDVKIYPSFTIWATGRVTMATNVLNGSANKAFTLPGWKLHNVAVKPEIAWTVDDEPTRATFFDSASGSSVSAINVSGTGAITPGVGAERYWTQPGREMPVPSEFRTTAEIAVGVLPSEAKARAADLLSPGIDMVAGGQAGTGTFEPARSAYVIAALSSGPVTFRLRRNLARFDPAFEVEAFGSPTFRIVLDGATIASNTEPVTARAAARYDAMSRRLLFVYFGSIPANAGDAASTFTLER